MSDPVLTRLKSDVATLKQRADNQGKRIDELSTRLREIFDQLGPLSGEEGRRIAASGERTSATVSVAKHSLYELQKRVVTLEKRRRGA